MNLYHFLSKILDIKVEYVDLQDYERCAHYRMIECVCYDIISEHFNLRHDTNRTTHFSYIRNIIIKEKNIDINIDDTFDFYNIKNIKSIERLMKLTLLNYGNN